MASNIVAIAERERGNARTHVAPYFVQEEGAALALATADAIDAAVAQATSDLGSSPSSVDYRRLGPRSVRVVAQYELNEPSSELTYRFSFQARGRHRYLADSCVGVYDAGGDVTADWETLDVNVQPQAGSAAQCLGMQINPLPEVFSLEYRLANASVSATYQNAVAAMCGAFNSATFRGYAAGQIQLVRASGAKRTSSDWQLSYGFGYRPNESSVAVGDITIPTLLGSQEFWVYRALAQNSPIHAIVPYPRFAIVQEFWPALDLNNLNLPS